MVAVGILGCTSHKPRVLQPTKKPVSEHRCGSGRIAIGMAKQDVLTQIFGHPAGDHMHQPYHANASPSSLAKRDCFGLIFGTAETENRGSLNVYFVDGKVSKIEVMTWTGNE